MSIIVNAGDLFLHIAKVGITVVSFAVELSAHHLLQSSSCGELPEVASDVS